MNMEDEEEEEKEEEEDVDFNPFSREEPVSEASSSLSPDSASPCDGGNLAEEFPSSLNKQGTKLTCRVGEDGEIVKQGKLTNEDGNGNFVVSEGPSLIREPNARDISTSPDRNSGEHNSSNENGGGYQLMIEAQTTTPNTVGTGEIVNEMNNDDAICTRTRARHSLANYTLDELEAFLQESEGEDDLQNVDDEEEYRKFLAAVLLGVGEKSQPGQEDDTLDEDEENDVDFIVELEEALETDTDEAVENNKAPGNENEEDVHFHRPETRQKKRLKESIDGKKKFLGQGKTPLRPILPHTSHPQLAAAPPYGWQLSSPQNLPHCSSSLYVPNMTIGFTVQQIGQLYCLIHEHIQLLIQIYSVSVLDPSHQEVAIEVQKMINEMVVKHEQALAWRKVAYNISYFQPPNICASWQTDSHQTPGFSYWRPIIEKPIHSILDVAPLHLVKDYMSNISAVILRQRHRHLEDPADRLTFKKEPLFPSPFTASHREIDQGSPGRVSTMSIQTASPLAPCQLQPKKSLAAALVESTKKQSVILVPKDIAKLAQRFYPLFNLALFPHKPPAPSVANRVLFTDAEDGLLAMGLMKYNNDWGAIQKHLLPCKSKHQIFVRQKNRSSSKAPENQIKAVRRMKMSPLTAEEKACIYEGLKVFKHDWLSIWKYFVPHRDPSLLQRQWRIATGTQKSYKKPEALKEKRRLYEAQRRKLKSLKEVNNEVESSGDEMETENEAYVHEAFLVDLEHGGSSNSAQDGMLYNNTFCSWQSTPQPGDRVQSLQEGSSLLSASHGSYPLSLSVDTGSCRPTNQRSLDSNLRTFGYQLGSLQASKRKSAHVIKLAPGLPPVNLPPSVRVIPQSEFTSCQTGSSQLSVSKNIVRIFPSGSRLDSQASSYKHVKRSLNSGLLDNCQHVVNNPADQNVSAENVSESDLEMHPLLFQTPEDQYSAYHSVNQNITSTAYNFLPPDQIHNEPESFASQHLVAGDSSNRRSTPRETPSDLCTIDFHPLLRRTDDASPNSRIASRADLISGKLNRRNNSAKLVTSSTCATREVSANNNYLTTDRTSHCHYDEENNIDLDLCFYSMVSKENIKGGKDTRNHQSADLSSLARERLMVEKSASVDMSLNLHVNKLHEVAVSSCSINHSNASREDDPGTSQCQNKGTSQFTADQYDDSSMQDIIMEKEELSDSEVESENIEFECEDLDDSSEEEWNSTRPSDLLEQGIPCTLDLGEKHGASHCLGQRDESTSVREGIVEAGRNCDVLQTRESACHTEVSQTKTKNEKSKRDRPSNSQDVLKLDNGLCSRSQKPKISKMHPSRSRQPHPRTGNECKNIAPRKYRRPSLCK